MHTRLPCILPSHVPMVLSNSLSSLTKATASLPQIMSGYVTISINPAPKGKRKHKNTQGVKKKKWKWVEQWKREDKRCIIHVYRQILLEKKLNNYLCAKLMKALKCSLVLMPRWWLHVCSCSHAWIDSLNCMILQHNEGIWRNTNHCHLNAILKLAGLWLLQTYRPPCTCIHIHSWRYILLHNETLIPPDNPDEVRSGVFAILKLCQR